MKKKPINQFDTLVDKLIHEFSKIPNFDLTQTEDIGNKILSFNDILHINEAKLSVLLTSIIAGLAGYFLLRNTKMKYKDS